MQRHRWLLRGLLASLLIGFTPLLAAPWPAAAQELDLPLVRTSAVQLADSVRYGVQLPPQSPRQALRDVRVEVTLPPGADLVEALETPGFTQYQGRQGDVLSWTANFLTDDYVDAFSFRLRQAASGPLVVRARWGGTTPGEAALSAEPEVQMARVLEGEVLLGSEGTAELLAAGETGVGIGLAAGVVAQPTRVQVRRLGPEVNPPAAVGDLWWCAAVELTGLPDGARTLVSLPTRQVLPLGTEITLFARRGDRWEALSDKGITGPDGQSVLFVHPGGTIAAGTSGAVQSRPPSSGTAATTTPTPRPGPTATPTTVSLAPRTTNLVPDASAVRQAISELPPTGSSNPPFTPFTHETDQSALPGNCEGRPLCNPCNPNALVGACNNGAGGITSCLDLVNCSAVNPIPSDPGHRRLCNFVLGIPSANGTIHTTGSCSTVRTPG